MFLHKGFSHCNKKYLYFLILLTKNLETLSKLDSHNKSSLSLSGKEPKITVNHLSGIHTLIILEKLTIIQIFQEKIVLQVFAIVTWMQKF